MILRLLNYLVPVGIFLSAGFAGAATPALKLGDAVDTESLQAAEWIQGEGPKSFEPGKLYMFECWATWCGGCVANIPHLNDLHAKFRDKGLLVYGMDVWEDDKEKVSQFVRKKGDGMTYPVAFTGKGSAFDQKWLRAARQRSIPHVFLVKDGKLVLACGPGYLTNEAVAALLDPATCEATAERIHRKAFAFERMANVRFDFDRAKEKQDFAAMEKMIAECEQEKLGDAPIRALKLDLRFAKKDWQGAVKIIDDLAQGDARDLQVRKLAQRIAHWHDSVFVQDFAKPFAAILAENLKSGASRVKAEDYLYLAVIQWRTDSRDAACASAEKAVELARQQAGTSAASIAAFEKFAGAMKAGTLPALNEFKAWSRAE